MSAQLCLWVVASLSTSAAATGELSLEQAQQLARANSADAAALVANVRGATEVARDARRLLRTEPSLSAAYRREIGGEAAAWKLGLNWTLDLTGSWALRKEGAEAALRGADQERTAQLLALDETVAIAFAELQFTQRQVRRTQAVLRLRGVVATAAARELEVGTGNQLDADGAQLDLAAATVEVAQADGRLRAAQAALARLLSVDAEALTADDPEGPAIVVGITNVEAVAAADPRLRAAEQRLDAAREQLRLDTRLAWPSPTLGASVGRTDNEIPPGAFGPGLSGVRAKWTDWELGVRLAVPLSFVDRRQEARARASAQLWTAEAELALLRTRVLAELQRAVAELSAASRAYEGSSSVEPIIARDYLLLEKAVAAGGLDAPSRALLVKRLVDAGIQRDLVVRDYRIATAGWLRRAGSDR